MNWPDLTKLTDPTKGDAEEVQPTGHEVNPYAPGEADGSSRQADRPSFMLLVLGIVILVSALGCMAFAAMLPGMVRPDAPGRLVAEAATSAILSRMKSTIPFVTPKKE